MAKTLVCIPRTLPHSLPVLNGASGAVKPGLGQAGGGGVPPATASPRSQETEQNPHACTERCLGIAWARAMSVGS